MYYLIDFVIFAYNKIIFDLMVYFLKVLKNHYL